ncbi:MAG: zinc-binding dehydrogenase [Anaerolineales bacterium]|nr:zinc-binding dehydrogenase [Chloroflexota bacterium]MBL6981258.1 zinc-binding dehydrogenase [Anaerolineales bacterium]
MKAILFHEHGLPEVLQYADFPTPEPGSGEVLVKLKAAALNRLDLWVREGWPGIKLEYPHIPGADGAGEVAALGEGVDKWEIGDRVVINSNLGCGICDFCRDGKDNLCSKWHLLGETIRGTYAEYVVVPERQLHPMPENFDAATAAAAALVYHTAWHSLITRGNVRMGEKVLIVGASGGVNTACIQIAKLTGALVYVVGSNTEKLAVAESLGADYLIDRSIEENWSKVVYRMTERRGVDVVVDNVGTTFPQSFRAARKGGRILTVGNTGGPKFEIDNRFVFSKHLSIIGSTMGTRADFATVMDLVFAGKLSVAMDITFPLEEAATAQSRLENGQQLGKITLTIND